MTIPPLSSSEDESARSLPSDRYADALSVGLDAEPSAAWAKLTPDQRRDVEAHINGLTSDAETYNTPRRGWTCFHCGETFRTEDGARLHFGEKVTGRPACVHEAIAKAIDANIQASFSGHSGWSLIGHRKASDAILEALAAQPAPSDPSTAWDKDALAALLMLWIDQHHENRQAQAADVAEAIINHAPLPEGPVCKGSIAAPGAQSPGPVNCTHFLRRNGYAYPRTCERCGLGPCPFYNNDGSAKR